jgi:hypothetical protein
MKGSGQKALSKGMVAGFATLLPLVLAPTEAAAAACATKFLQCCTISAPGSYTMGGFLKAPANTQTCIDITASNVILDVNTDGGRVEGPGADTATVGIHIEASAKRVSLFNIETDYFGQGIRIDGPNATLDFVSAEINQMGIVVNGANALIAESYVTGNGSGDGVGIQINKTATHFAILESGVVDYNGVGIELNGVSEGVLDGSSTYYNGTFGIWLNGASNNVITNFKSDNNGIAGVYLGCSPAGPDGDASCPSNASSNSNFVLGDELGDSTVESAGYPLQSYGVAVELGSLLDDVLAVTGDGNLVDDALDQNPTCGSNRWLGNTFTISNPVQNTTDYCIN